MKDSQPQEFKHYRNPTFRTSDATTESRKLLFVPYAAGNAPSALRPDEASIRQHLMVDFHRRKQLNQLDVSTEVDAAQPAKPPRTRLGRFRIKRDDVGKPRDLRLIVPKLISGEGAATQLTSDEHSIAAKSLPMPPVQDVLSTYQRDPFVRFPVPASNEVHYLFGYYMTELNRQGAITKYEREFLTIALDNSACFLMLMTTLVQFRHLQGVRCEKTFWSYRGAAMSELKTQLSSANSLTDQLICTISMLAYIDLRCPELHSETAKVHLAAIVRGLDLRKGSRKPELYCMLLRLSNWCLVPPSCLDAPPLPLPRDDGFDFEKNFPTRSQGSVDVPPSVFDDVKFLLHSKVEDPLRQPGDDDIMRCASDEGFQEFLSFRLTHAANMLGKKLYTSTPELSSMMRSVYLSKIMFLYIVSPAITLSGVSPSTIAMFLRTSLEAGLTPPSGSSPAVWNPELLCWVLMTGAVTKQDDAHRGWFVRRVAEYCSLYGIYSFDGLAESLQRVAWADGKFAQSCQRVWSEVEKINQH